MSHTAIRPVAIAALLVGAGVLAACSAEPVSSAFPEGPRPVTSVSASARPAPTPSVTITGAPIPADCTALYSPAMRASLESGLGPLNAAGFELVSTQNADGLEVISSSAGTIRCTWGTPGQDGLSTNVTAVTAEQAVTLVSSYAAAGAGCEPALQGTLCTFEQRTVTLDDKQVTRGEAQYFRGDRWVSTSWVGAVLTGYTEDIVSRLWG